MSYETTWVPVRVPVVTVAVTEVVVVSKTAWSFFTL